MIKIVVLWVVMATPKQTCVDARKPKDVIVTVVGTTQTYRSQQSQGEPLTDKYQVVYGEKPKVQKDPCYDVYIGKIDVKAVKEAQ